MGVRDALGAWDEVEEDQRSTVRNRGRLAIGGVRFRGFQDGVRTRYGGRLRTGMNVGVWKVSGRGARHRVNGWAGLVAIIVATGWNKKPLLVGSLSSLGHCLRGSSWGQDGGASAYLV